MDKRIEFETFKDMTGSYSINNMKKDEPSAINFLSYRKYRVIIEEVEEPISVLIERLKKLLDETDNFRRKSKIKDEIQRLEKKIEQS